MPNELIVKLQDYRSTGKANIGNEIYNELVKEGKKWIK